MLGLLPLPTEIYLLAHTIKANIGHLFAFIFFDEKQFVFAIFGRDFNPLLS